MKINNLLIPNILTENSVGLENRNAVNNLISDMMTAHVERVNKELEALLFLISARGAKTYEKMGNLLDVNL